MKKVLTASVAVGFLAVLGCISMPSILEAPVTVDIRNNIEEQAASLLDFIEGKTDEMPVFESPADEDRDESERPIAEVFEGLCERNGEVEAVKAKKHIRESGRGYLKLREDGEFVDAEERNETQRLIAAENKDRKALYIEIAMLNKEQNVSVSMVEKVYAFERIKRAKVGDVLQLPSAGEDFDAFKESSVGKKLGEDCKPKAWVTIK